jgi:2-methylisocitrate lyase-like PEP mutase family enzyme
MTRMPERRPAEPRASELRALHRARELLVMVNVWDVASARTVAAQDGCRALATTSALALFSPRTALESAVYRGP